MGRLVASSCSFVFRRPVRHSLPYFPGHGKSPDTFPSENQPIPAVPGYQLPLCSFNRLRMPCENLRVCLSIGGICLNLFQPAVLGGDTRDEHHFWCQIRVPAAPSATSCTHPGQQRRAGPAPTEPGDETHLSKVKTFHF